MKSPETNSSPTTDSKNVLSILAKLDFNPAIAVERQVAAHVKSLIEDGTLAPGTRLPTIRRLAELWDTNYFTVQAALRRVFATGLIVQSPKLGTFVAVGERVLRRVCLYHDHALRFSASDDFYSMLNLWLYRLLAEKGIQLVTYFDHRDTEELSHCPEEIRNMVRDRQTDAIIASAIYPNNTSWLEKLGVPCAALALKPKHGGISMDFEGFAKQAITEVVRAGKKHVGLLLLLPHEDNLAERGLAWWIGKYASEAGLKMSSPDASEVGTSHKSLEEQGYHHCKSILARKERPDALIIFPDTYARGVFSALMKHHVEVPRDMIVLSHRNAEYTIFTPFPVIWLTVKIEDTARALIRQITNQFAGVKTGRVLIRSKVETGS